jgi:hypothetical protein
MRCSLPSNTSAQEAERYADSLLTQAQQQAARTA